MAWALPDDATLGIFAKRPDPGRVKTRLAREYDDAFAARVAEAMLLDTIDLWGSSAFLAPGGRRVVVFDPPDSGDWFDARVPASFALQPQAEGDLGERMRSFFEGEFAEGAKRVVLIGADSPTLDPSFVISAFLCLENQDIVIGPAVDGGYYLIGCRGKTPPIFGGIDWSSSRVLGQTIDRLYGVDASLSALPPWYDVDSADDWDTLVGHVRAMKRSGMDPRLPRIEALIAENATPERGRSERL